MAEVHAHEASVGPCSMPIIPPPKSRPLEYSRHEPVLRTERSCSSLSFHIQPTASCQDLVWKSFLSSTTSHCTDTRPSTGASSTAGPGSTLVVPIAVPSSLNVTPLLAARRFRKA